MTESAVTFSCDSMPLVGIVHKPAKVSRRGVLMVVGGGPQYRAGGHRQLTLWARRLCDEGYPVFRFDYRGMGDAHGEFRGFEDVDRDIAAAITCFKQSVPGIDELVLWGECDAASAILFFASREPDLHGAVLLNPWARTEAGEAKAILKHYYLRRVMEPSFWKKVLSLKFNPIEAMSSVVRIITRSRLAGTTALDSAALQSRSKSEPDRNMPLPDRLLAGMRQLNGPVLLILSGRDLIAREFATLIDGSGPWCQELENKPTTRHNFPESDHTFSSAAQRSAVIETSLQWLRSW
jgi:uncharacterized protein